MKTEPSIHEIQTIITKYKTEVDVLYHPLITESYYSKLQKMHRLGFVSLLPETHLKLYSLKYKKSTTFPKAIND